MSEQPQESNPSSYTVTQALGILGHSVFYNGFGTGVSLYSSAAWRDVGH